MLKEVKCYEAKFLGMIVRSEGKGKDRKLIRSDKPAVIPGVGKIDAEQKTDKAGNVVWRSPTYGERVCKVGDTYKLDEWQMKKFGGAFGKPKEVEGYVIDDGESPEEANVLTPKEIQEIEKKRKEEEQELLKEKAKRDAELEANAEVATTERTKPDLQPTGKFANIEGSGGKVAEKREAGEAPKSRKEQLEDKGAGEVKDMVKAEGLPVERTKSDNIDALVAFEEKLAEVKALDEAALKAKAEENGVEVPDPETEEGKDFDLVRAVTMSELYE